MSTPPKAFEENNDAGVPSIRIVRDPHPRLIAEVIYADGRISTDWDDFLRARGLGEDALPPDDDTVGVQAVPAA